MIQPSHPEPSRDGSAPECPAATSDPILSAYALDEVTGDERRRLEDHVATCPACREELALLSRAAEVLREGPAVEATLGAAGRERILEAARRGAGAVVSTVPRGRRPIFYWVAGLAAAALIAVGVLPWGSFGARKPAESPLVVKQVEKLNAPAAGAPVEVALTKLDSLARQPGADPNQWGLPALEQAAGDAAAGAEARKPLVLAREMRTQPAEVQQAVEHFTLAYDAAAVSESKQVQGLEEARQLDEGRRAGYDNVREEERRLDRYYFAEAVEAGKPVTELTDRLEALQAGGTETAAEGKRPVKYLEALSERSRGDTATKLADEALRTQLALRADGAGRGGGGLGLKEEVKAQLKEAESLSKVDGIDLTRQADGFVHEFAPKKEPARYSRAQIPPASDRDAAAPAPEPAQARPLTVATAVSASRGAAPATPPVPDPRFGGVPAAAAPPAGAAIPTDLGAVIPTGPTGPAPGPTGAYLAPIQPAPGAAPVAAGGAVAGGLAAEPAGNTTVVPPQPDWKAKVDEFLTKLDRKPGETPDMMFFRYWGDNPFVEAANDPQSTFGADADTASYTLARSYLYKQGILPPREAVRSEEFINYFRSRYAPPTEEGRAFAIHCEAAPSPFGHDPEYRLLKVGLKGREVPREKRKAASLAFVVDTSGSMRRENRLELVKDALRLLVPELDEGDTIGIAAFDAEARTVLEPSPASARERILDAISRLEPRQNTNVAAGLELGFQMAAARRLKDGTNRVILLSDGVANTGVTDPEAMLERVRAQREQGIYLTCVGVGMGNHNDTLLEQLADRGNGQCVYVDRLEEARKVFVEDLTATLEAIARDVKIQVEFDPARVIRYRLLGYENRAIADALFRDNKVDAGEVGAGHEVAALYELKLQGAPAAAGKLATVRVRYLTIEHGEAVELARDVTGADVKASFAEAAPRFRISACAAEFAEVLRESYHARGSELDKVAAIVEGLLGSPDGDGRKVGDDQNVVELAALLRRADALVRERERQLTEVARTTEALKENYFLRAQVEDALQARREQNRVQLDDILRQNDALRRRLEDLLAAPR